MPEGKDSMLGHFNQCLHQIKIEQQHDWKGFFTARGLSSIIQAGSSIELVLLHTLPGRKSKQKKRLRPNLAVTN